MDRLSKARFLFEGRCDKRIVIRVGPRVYQGGRAMSASGGS